MTSNLTLPNGSDFSLFQGFGFRTKTPHNFVSVLELKINLTVLKVVLPLNQNNSN